MCDDTNPNIVFILADDHGYGDISANNGPGVQTPHIDAIGSRGIRFNRFYANSTVCSPSRASLLTGRYPDRVGVPGVIRQTVEDSWGYFDPNAITLPDMLRRAGYETLHIGKWHLGLEDENHPCERGFDEFHGFIDDMMDDYWTHRRMGQECHAPQPGGYRPGGTRHRFIHRLGDRPHPRSGRIRKAVLHVSCL